MREITYEAYKATVVLLALLDTLWTNTHALSKVLRDGVMTDLAKRFSKLHSRAERLRNEARTVEIDAEDYEGERDYTQHAKALVRAARKMNREARVVARFYDIPTKEMYASELIRRMG